MVQVVEYSEILQSHERRLLNQVIQLVDVEAG